MDWSAIGKRIRQQREYMGFTREQFAEQIDVTPKFCSDIETGAKGMSVPTLCWMMVLENCSKRERTYAEQMLKIFVAAMNSNEEKTLL